MIVDKIQNALPEREGTQFNIYGMTGVPNAFIEQRMIHMAKDYWGQIIGQKQIITKN